MKKLTESQIEKNRIVASEKGYKLDEHGRIIVQENVKFRINARIEVQDDKED